MIASIKSYLPNSFGKLYEVDDLTSSIQSSVITLTADEEETASHFFKTDQSVASDATFEFEVIGGLTEESVQSS